MDSAAQARLQGARVLMKDEYEGCRELSLATTKLDECPMRLGRAPQKAVPRDGGPRMEGTD